MTAHSENIVRVQTRTYHKNYNSCKGNFSLIARRIIWVFLLLLISQLSLITPVYAQVSTPSAVSTVPYNLYPAPSSVSPTSPLYTDLLLNNMFHSFSCLAIGSSVIGQPCLTYQITKNAQGMIQSVPMLSQVNLSGGTLGAVSSLIGALYLNPPVRTADYLASVGQDLGLVKEAHAQVVGSGANVLSPIIKLWQVSRNVSYVIMIIIFVVIGLMVMFRQKINPQTVITAQAALPGLVIGLILITFSYFLAGLISDMAFVGTNVVGYYFAAAQEKTTDPATTNLVQKTSGESELSIFSRFVGLISQSDASGVVSAIWKELGGTTQNYIRVFLGFMAANFVQPLTGAIPPPAGLIVGPIVSAIFGGAVAIWPHFFLGWLLSFIATFALIYQMLKLLIRLISTYLTIIFLTITAPFHFLAASLPGRQGLATNWVRNMLGNILVFPAVIAVFYFVAYILGKTDSPFSVSTTTSITGTSAFPLFGGINLDFIKILVAFGALMALPSIPDIVTRTIGKPSQAGQLLGQEISGGIRSGQGYFNQTRGAIGGYLASAKQNLWGERGMLYNPQTGEYYPGLTRAGFFNYRKAPPKKTGVKQPTPTEGLQ